MFIYSLHAFFAKHIPANGNKIVCVILHFTKESSTINFLFTKEETCSIMICFRPAVAELSFAAPAFAHVVSLSLFQVQTKIISSRLQCD